MGLFANFKELVFGRTIHIENLDHKSLPVETLSNDEIDTYFDIQNHVVQAKQPAIEDKFLSVPEEFDEYMKLDNLFKYSWCKKWCEISNKKLSIYQSENFLMLSYDEERRNHLLLKFAEKACDQIYGVIGEQIVGIPGKILIFNVKQDDYYAMENLLYTNPLEGGVLSGGMFVHGVIPYMILLNQAGQGLPDSTLAHELTHALLFNNEIPTWLNEALACTMEKSITGFCRYDWSLEKGLQNVSYWDEVTIQQFWTGESFHINDSQDFSYLLSQGLLNIIIREFRDSFKEFITKAKFEDAGEQAALDCLGFSLNDIASQYMGEGPWRPDIECVDESPELDQ